MAQAVEEWYRQMPIITRSYLTAAVVTTVGCALEIISPYHLYLNPKRVVQQYEIWRLVTNFLYFRKMGAMLHEELARSQFTDFIYDCPVLSKALFTHSSMECLCILGLFHVYVCTVSRLVNYLDFLFHMFFLARYCKLLEENSFRGRTADFFYMLLFGATVLTGIVLIGGMIPYISETFARILFLSNSLTFMMVYVWSKHNPFIHMSFLGLFTFTAAYLPWVLLGFSILVGSSTWVDVLGMIAGHVYYFLEDVYPRMTGRRPLKTPSFIKALFPDEHVVVARAPNAGVGAGARFGEVQ
ncbi:Derlin-2.2 [Dichanthelium oligosanthes]|uniref:Derlin n=1 Tax=Dichanthelium oligosanthes TaxID=888268 RepID=A0A1E5W0W3_9POAL|nr:Derlin-2.2 [Dichanthelium oligosanthes]